MRGLESKAEDTEKVLLEGICLNYQKSILLPALSTCFQEQNRTSLGFASNLPIWASHLFILSQGVSCLQNEGDEGFTVVMVLFCFVFFIVVFQTRSKFLRNASRILQTFYCNLSSLIHQYFIFIFKNFNTNFMQSSGLCQILLYQSPCGFLFVCNNLLKNKKKIIHLNL